jgi:hypothetical protein
MRSLTTQSSTTGAWSRFYESVSDEKVSGNYFLNFRIVDKIKSKNDSILL